MFKKSYILKLNYKVVQKNNNNSKILKFILKVQINYYFEIYLQWFNTIVIVYILFELDLIQVLM